MVRQNKGQSVVEYILLLTAVVSIILVGFKTDLPKVQNSAHLFYNRVAVGLLGKPNPCGDGICSDFENQESCCVDCKLSSGSPDERQGIGCVAPFNEIH